MLLSCNRMCAVFVGFSFSPLKPRLAASFEGASEHPFHVAAAVASFTPEKKKKTVCNCFITVPLPLAQLDRVHTE